MKRDLDALYPAPARCPKCGLTYRERPAVSRIDGRDICPDCGIREALAALGVVSLEDQDHILDLIHARKNGHE